MRTPQYYDGEGIFFDTHAHIYDERFAEEGSAVSDILDRAARSGVKRLLIPADCEKSSRKAVDLCRDYNSKFGLELYCSVGVHPHEAKDYTQETEDYLRACLSDRENLRIKALGEIGLDYYYDLSDRAVQRDIFARQLDLAFEYDIPFILHEREATGDCLDILRSRYKSGKLRANPGVCHCCSMSPTPAMEMVDMGFYIGFDGPVTFKNNKKTPEVAALVPLERIVLETDSPYLTPEPNRGASNEPCFVPFVAAKIADIRGMTTSEIARITYDNANRLYEI